MKKFLSASLFPVTAMALAISTQSAQSFDHIGWYVGGQVGQATTKMTPEVANIPEHKNTSVVVGPYGGYNFTEVFGIEATIDFMSSADKNVFPLDITKSANYYIATLQPKLTYQANDQVGFFIKIGINLTSYDIDAKKLQGTSDESWSGVGLAAGAGVQFSLTENLNLRLAYEYAQATLDPANDNQPFFNENIDSKLSQYSVGIHYQF